MIPQTGYEASGKTRWSTPADEAAFLRKVAADTDVELTIEGYSVMGNPMWCASIGTGTTVMIVANVHAGEPSGRDAALSWLRDLAYGLVPEFQDFLTTHRIVLMPNINIDGSNRPYKRANANGTNLNRDYIALRQPETRAIARVVQREHPVLILDMHEVGDDQGHEWRPFWNAPPDAPPASLALAEQFRNDVADRLLATTGGTTREYAASLITWSMLASVAPAWHAIGMLSEAAYRGRTFEERFTTNYEVIRTLIEFTVAHAPDMEAAQAASMSASRETVRVPTMKRINASPVETVPGDTVFTINGTVPAELFELHGIEWDGQTVSLDQPAGILAAYLLAPNSYEGIANLEAWGPAPEGTPAPEPVSGRRSLGFVSSGGVLRTVQEAWVKHGGMLRPVREAWVRQGGQLRKIS